MFYKKGRNQIINKVIYNKPIFIINGCAGVGKDAFVKACGLYIEVLNYSSINKVKEIARITGWDGNKDEKSRKFLSDLKVLTSEYNDMSYNDMRLRVSFFNKNNSYGVMFLHIREPEEIEKSKQEFNAKTILIVRDSVKHVVSNMADANVFKYDYDYTIHNNGTLDDLRIKAKCFLMETCRGII